MRTRSALGTFLAGLLAGVVISVAVVARAGWNDQPAYGPDRTLLEKIARSGEDSARRLGDIAEATKDVARRSGDIASAGSETARAVAEIARRCK